MRRFLIGAAAAAAVFASASAPAQAHHDQVCLPEVPGPVCITGLQHVVPATKAEAWEAFESVFWPVALAAQQPYNELNAIPDPLCSGGPAPICVSGLRGAAQLAYIVGYVVAFVPAYIAVCTAVGPSECHLTLPPVPPV